ncbi:hypothetical protein TNCV_3826051 [Trichonephila clavipes]|nr:hypothetical protein TNCV_3826051 [Trichonephila clavipes]
MKSFSKYRTDSSSLEVNDKATNDGFVVMENFTENLRDGQRPDVLTSRLWRGKGAGGFVPKEDDGGGNATYG